VKEADAGFEGGARLEIDRSHRRVDLPAAARHRRRSVGARDAQAYVTLGEVEASGYGLRVGSHVHDPQGAADELADPHGCGTGELEAKR
jgi:hypothetical protein